MQFRKGRDESRVVDRHNIWISEILDTNEAQAVQAMDQYIYIYNCAIQLSH